MNMNIPQEVPIKCYAVSIVMLRETHGAIEVLLLRRADALLNGEWFPIAGGIEAGETAWQAALREIKEETGLTPDRLYSADYCEQFYNADRDCVSLMPVFVGFLDTPQLVILNHEHSEYRWMTFAEADAVLPFAIQRAMLQHVFKQFIERQPSKWLLIDTSEKL